MKVYTKYPWIKLYQNYSNEQPHHLPITRGDNDKIGKLYRRLLTKLSIAKGDSKFKRRVILNAEITLTIFDRTTGHI